jgi:hypothetical protein
MHRRRLLQAELMRSPRVERAAVLLMLGLLGVLVLSVLHGYHTLAT